MANITKENVLRCAKLAKEYEAARMELLGEDIIGSAVSVRNRQQVKEIADACGAEIVRKQYKSIAAYDVYVDGVLFFFTESSEPSEDF